ncbi:S-layer homology domain-containing protein [Myxosarcina sp. GI1(2024)]
MIRSLKYLFLSMVLSISTCTAIELCTETSSVLAQTIFPDLPADYWANPFIQKLAERNIVVGYPNGNFKPQQPIERDEFAAMIHQAFERESKREISSASKFQDVPENYWAEMAIAEAYETGFMQTTDENNFSPNLPVSKTDAIVALTTGLEMSFTERQDLLTTRLAAKRSKVTNNRLPFPLASTAIMTPVMSLASIEIMAPFALIDSLPRDIELSALATVEVYYEDADSVPNQVIDNIAVATKRGMVVNYPRPKYLEPDRSLSRGAATALVHQALVSIDKLPPLAGTTDASKYIVLPKEN